MTSESSLPFEEESAELRVFHHLGYGGDDGAMALL